MWGGEERLPASNVTGRRAGGFPLRVFQLVRPSAIVGIAILLLASGTMLAWVLRLPALVEPVGGFAMVFNTALCFALLASATIIDDPASRMRVVAQQLLGGIVLAIAGLTLSQYWLGYSLGIDWPGLHSWLTNANPHPGRMSRATSVVFLLCGAVILSMHRVRRLWTGLLVQVLTAAAGLIGAAALAGLILELQYVYADYLFVHMSAQTAAAFVVSSVALWLCWRGADWYRARSLIRNEGQRISLIGAAILGAVVSLSVIAGFSIARREVEEATGDGLVRTLRGHANLFADHIQLRLTRAQLIGNRPGAINHLRSLNARPDDAAALARLREVAESFLPLGFSAVAFYGPTGREWLRVGRFGGEPALSVNLNQPYPARLLWDGRLVLNTSLPMSSGGAEAVGMVVAEQPLPALAKVLGDTGELGETGEIGVCAAGEGKFHCFPQRLMPKVFSVPYSKTLPMAQALAGATGIMKTGDYRAQNVIAAHGPIGDFGLGMVVKMDTAELYAPIRERFNAALLLLLALTAGGAMLLYWRLKPLVGELERSRELIREKGERDLHASEERYRYLFEANPMPMWVLDAETLRFLAVNDAVLEAYGYTREEFLSMTAYDLRTPEDLPAYRDYIRTRDPRSHTHRLTRHRRKDGSVRDVETTVHAIDFQGRPARLSLVNDVTDRLRAKRVLQESEDRYRTLFELSPAPIVVRQRDEIRYANPAAVRFFGALSAEELTARSWLSLIHPDERDEARGRMREVDEDGRLTLPRARRFLRVDGSLAIGETSAVTMPFGGESLAIVAIHDVTERLRAEQEVRRLNTELEQRVAERTAQLRAVTDTANDAIISADKEGRIVYFNRGAERMFGFSAMEATGEPLTILMPESSRAAHRSGLQRFLTTGQARVIGKTLDLTAVKRDGTEFPVEVSIANWSTPEGIFFTAILRDITDRKQAEEALTASNKELESFSYSVSHDLRSPLRAMDGFSRILQEDYGNKLDDEGRRLLGVVRDNSRKMGQLIDDLLAFSRLGRKPLSVAVIDMNRLVKEALGELLPSGEKSPELALEALPPAHGDAVLVRQVWTNLLANAVKFSSKRARPVIEISGYENGAESIYSVKDNGAGFDMSYYDKLFGVFQRLHGAEEYQGTGVGLAIVQRVVTRHGGRVWAEGRVDEGAVFYFSLPKGGSIGPVREG